MQLTVDEVEKWEEVVSAVDKEYIPLNCVKKIIFKLQGNRQKTINIESLRKNGLDIDEIDGVVSRTVSTLNKNIVNVDYVIDVRIVAMYVQPITDKILSNL